MSRRDTLLWIVRVLMLLLLFAIGFGLLRLPGNGRVGPNERSAQDERSASDDRPAGQIAESPTQTEDAGFQPDSGVQPRPVAVQELTGEERENIRVYENLNRGVVNITTETVAYNCFYEPIPRQGTSGSGSIIDVRGYVLTNHHVIQNAIKVFVTLADDVRYEGEVVGSDPENDLAVVRFEPGDTALTIVPMGDSARLRVGMKVLAIGNPFALDRTLTTGIISGLGRPVRVSGDLVVHNMIQTDASINPGNSGGPLLDVRGAMVGINTAIFSPSGGSIGIGFAVPANTARRVVPDLIAYGVVRRAGSR